MCRRVSQLIPRTILTIAMAMGMSASVHAANAISEGDALFEASTESPKVLEGVYLGAAKAGSRMLLAGERGHIVYSDDNGDSWHQASVPVRATLTSIFFLNAKQGWAVGHDTVILATTDGGRSWEKQLDGYQATELVYASASERLAKLQALQDTEQDVDPAQLQMQLEFAEIAMEEAERDMEIGPAKALMDVWFPDANNGLVIGANGYVLRTSDGGASWQDWSDRIGNPDMMHLYKLVDGRDGVVYLVGEAGMAYRSSDLGAHWQVLELPYAGSLFSGLVRDSDHNVYLFGLSGVILRSEDRGKSWATIPSNSKSILQNGTINSEDRVVIVGLGGVLLQENENRTEFEPVPLGGRSALTVVLAGSNGRLVVAGEAGVQAFDPADQPMTQSESLRFMFHKR